MGYVLKNLKRLLQKIFTYGFRNIFEIQYGRAQQQNQRWPPRVAILVYVLVTRSVKLSQNEIVEILKTLWPPIR